MSIKVETKDPIIPTPTVVPPVVATEVSIATEEKKLENKCPHCGLPKNEWEDIYNRLRPDLQIKNARKLCPRCFEPVEW